MTCVPSEDSNQPGHLRWMPRLMLVFAGLTCHFVSFVMRWLIGVTNCILDLQFQVVTSYHPAFYLCYFSALENVRPNKRSLVISRSTFAGTGVHGGHWSGDNNAQWTDLYDSITGNRYEKRPLISYMQVPRVQIGLHISAV